MRLLPTRIGHDDKRVGKGARCAARYGIARDAPLPTLRRYSLFAIRYSHWHHTVLRDSAISMRCPRHTKPPIQPLTQSAGTRRSRSIHSNGDRQVRCQPAAQREHGLAGVPGERQGDRPVPVTDTSAAACRERGGAQRQQAAGQDFRNEVRLEGRAAQARPSRLPLPDLGCATEPQAAGRTAHRRGARAGPHCARPWWRRHPRQSRRPAQRIPPARSSTSRHQNIVFPWAKPNPRLSATYCQRAW